MVIRGTTKLLGRLGVRPDAAPAPSSGALGDWFATMVQVRRGRFVLAVSGVTLLPVIVVGRELATLPARLADAVADVMLELGIHRDAVERERLAMADASYARTNDRSTVGVLTDFQRLLRYDLEDAPNTGLLERSLRLAETPIVARNLFPDRATRLLFDAIKAARPTRR
jgi:hypothetical protein